MWAASGSAAVAGLSGYWWYRLRRIESRAERLMRKMRSEIDALPAQEPMA
jgi:hypothetical protein